VQPASVQKANHRLRIS